MPIGYEPQEKKIICRYANGVILVLDFLEQPFGVGQASVPHNWKRQREAGRGSHWPFADASRYDFRKDSRQPT